MTKKLTLAKENNKFTPFTNWSLMLGLTALYLLLRIPGLTNIPIFTDEACFVRWTQLVSQSFSDHAFVTFTGAGKQPLFIWITSLFLPFFDDPALSIRVPSMLFGLLTLWGVIILSNDLFGSKFKYGPFLAGLFYALSPFAVFHERLGVFDPMVNALGVFAFIAAFRFVNGSNRKYYLIFGLILGAALITKAYAIFFLVYPFLLWGEWALKNKKIPPKSAFLFTGGALLIGYGIKVIVNYFPRALYGEKAFLSLSDYFFKSKYQLFTIWRLNISHAAEIYFSYLGVPVIILFLIFILFSIRNRESGSVSLICSIFGATGLQIILAYGIYARYLLFVVPLIIICSVWALLLLAQYISEKWSSSISPRSLQKLLTLIGSAAVALVFLMITIPMLANPITAPLDSQDRWQYITGWPSGYGMPEAVEFLKNESKDHPVDIFGKFQYKAGMVFDALKVNFEGYPNARLHLSMWEDKLPLLFFIKENITLDNLTSQNMELREKLYPNGFDHVYYVGNEPKFDPKVFIRLNNPTLIKRFPKPGGKSAVWVFKVPVPDISPEFQNNPRESFVEVNLRKLWLDDNNN